MALQFWPGTNFLETYREVLFVEGGVMKSVLGTTMLKNSLILGIGFAVGKVIISMLAGLCHRLFPFPPRSTTVLDYLHDAVAAAGSTYHSFLRG